MTGQMIIQIEELLINVKPNIVLVYGDTNSTLAGALAASKLNIPIAHVEAGLRSYWKNMPEEQNRILVDHLSTWLFCPTRTAVLNLTKEGIKQGVFKTGDIMLDASIYYTSKLNSKSSSEKNKLLENCGFPMHLINKEYFLLTIHRAENTGDSAKINSIFKGLASVSMEGIFPIHPRTRQKIESIGISIPPNIHLINPIGYFEMLLLQKKSKIIVTDSGGIQKEAFFIKKPCITLRDQTEWTETVYSKWNQLVGCDSDAIIEAFNYPQSKLTYPSCFGKGSSGENILKILSKAN